MVAWNVGDTLVIVYGSPHNRRRDVGSPATCCSATPELTSCDWAATSLDNKGCDLHNLGRYSTSTRECLITLFGPKIKYGKIICYRPRMRCVPAIRSSQTGIPNYAPKLGPLLRSHHCRGLQVLLSTRKLEFVISSQWLSQSHEPACSSVATFGPIISWS